jgi:hypothetical protein
VAGTSRRRGIATIASAALAFAMISPFGVASAAHAAEVGGMPLGLNASTWIDTTLEADMKRGVFYSSSVRGPAVAPPYRDLTTNGLPPGLTATLDTATGVVTVSGTPTTPATGVDFWLQFYATGGPYFISFNDFVVDPNKAATTIDADSAAFAAYDDVSLSAEVTGADPTGTVTFRLDGTAVGTGTIGADGIATYDGPVPDSFVGSSPVLTAHYAGDTANASSTSTSASSAPAIYLYASNTVTGTVTSNGSPVEGDVELRSGSTLIDAESTGADGVFSLTAPEPTSLTEAKAQFAIQSAETGTFYADSAGPGVANASTAGSATLTGRADWGTPKNVFFNVAPVWTDDVLARPRLAASYSDGVTATGTAPIAYSVGSGALPAWLSLNTATGALTSSGPTDSTVYTFEIAADNGFASVRKSFTVSALPVGLPPSFTDTALAIPQVGDAYDDAVAASGDPYADTVYSSTTLPDGLVLDAATGALTGRPTTAGGPTTVTITATNEFGAVSFDWEATVAPVAAIELSFGFLPGEKLLDAAVRMVGAGLAPGSAYSLRLDTALTPIESALVGANGGFDSAADVPATTAAGEHAMVLTAEALDGTVLLSQAWFSVLADGTIGAISYTGPVAPTVDPTDPETDPVPPAVDPADPETTAPVSPAVDPADVEATDSVPPAAHLATAGAEPVGLALAALALLTLGLGIRFRRRAVSR